MSHTSKRLSGYFFRCVFIIFCCHTPITQANDGFDYADLEGSPNVQRDISYLFQTDSAVQFSAIELTQKTLKPQALPDSASGSAAYAGYVSVAKDKNSFWVLTEERVQHPTDPPDAVPWLYYQWFRYNFAGRVIEERSAGVDSHGLRGDALPADIHLDHPKKPQSDATALVAFTKFKKHHFRWSSLNPLRGLGNPTGRTPNKDWDGIAEITLRLNNAAFTLPVQTQSTIDSGYQFQLMAYHLPGKQQSALLYLQSSPWKEPHPHALAEGLYLITCEGC